MKKRMNEKKNVSIFLTFFFWFWPSLRIAISIDGDVLESWMLLE
jgi:hypothetical protein